MYTSFIWDLDGTLIDSYHTIVDCLWETMRENGFTLDKQEIYHYTKTNSVMGFIELYGKKYGFDWEKA
ncbi:MAG: HAD hydrolase-like protein, partial [bacterium]